MNTISAHDIKRCGISAVDDALTNGPVHIVENNCSRYVVMSEEGYQEIVERLEDAEWIRIQASLADIAEGRFRRGNADELIRQLKLEN